MNNNYANMQEFLDVLKEFAISNPNQEITKDFVYSNLIRFHLKNHEFTSIPVIQQNYYEGWKEKFKNTNNLTVDDNVQGSFCWFLNTYDVYNAIKLYIPMDFEHIKEGANQLFAYIASTNMNHQSKIASKIRNDNIVVRVTNLEDSKKVIDFVANNKYIQEGMLQVNPFLPNVNGVGITMDNNKSFNGELSSVLADFIEWLKKENRLDLVNVEEFNKYVSFQSEHATDIELKEIYSLLSRTTASDFKINDFVVHAKNKLIDDYDKTGKRIVDPEHYLEKAILVTEKSYPGNSKDGILYYLHSDASRFTRKQNARDGLIKYVVPGSLIPLMRKKLNENGLNIPTSDSELVDAYLKVVLNRQKKEEIGKVSTENYQEQFNFIKKAYFNTLNTYGKFQADEAFRRLYLFNNPECFTNRFGDRDQLKILLSSVEVKKVILSNISLDNIDVNDVTVILNNFLQNLNLENNKKIL